MLLSKVTLPLLCFLSSTAAYQFPADVAANFQADAGSQANLAYSENGLMSRCARPGDFLLTIDDGPVPGITERFLDVLKQERVKAVFFLIGTNAAAHPDLVRRIIAEGHEVASHTHTHQSLRALSADGVRAELTNAKNAIEGITGVRMKALRPPYGEWSPAAVEIASKEFEYRTMIWNADSKDWESRNAAVMTSTTFQDIDKLNGKGAILLCHDTVSQTVDALKAWIDGIRARGYTFTTIDGCSSLAAPAAPPANNTTTPKADPAKSSAIETSYNPWLIAIAFYLMMRLFF